MDEVNDMDVMDNSKIPGTPTLAEMLVSLIGQAEGLPEDLSINHDHYLYGRRKVEE